MGQYQSKNTWQIGFLFVFFLFYFKKNVKKLSRIFEYSKLQNAKKLSVLRPALSVLLKSVYLEKILTENNIMSWYFLIVSA